MRVRSLSVLSTCPTRSWSVPHRRHRYDRSEYGDPTAGRRRRHKSPPTLHAQVALPAPRLDDHLDTEHGPSDEEGEKGATRQRSEPTTPISTFSRLPYEYDQVMGITQVGSGETEGFEEGIDLEYHDAAEDPNVLEPEENTREAVLSHGGCGSSSLRECIELLKVHRKIPCYLPLWAQDGE